MSDDAGETIERFQPYSADTRLALVCVDVPDRQGPVKSGLQELGYTLQMADDAPEALERMRKNTFEVIVLDEEFNGATEQDNDVLTAIRALPMTARRYLFVALIGRRFGTFDHMMAFAKSVNMVIHVSDLSEVKLILGRGIADNDRFYHAYHEVLREAGRR